MENHTEAAPTTLYYTTSWFTTSRIIKIQPDWFYLPATALGLLGLLTILANSFTIGFYQRKWREAVPFMYIMIGTCDFISGVIAICHAYIFTNYPIESIINLENEFHDLFILIVYALFQISTRTSLFYNTVLSVVRTINIIRPFYQMKKSIIIIVVILYPIIWILIMFIDLYMSRGYTDTLIARVICMPEPGKGVVRILKDIFGDDPSYNSVNVVTTGLVISLVLPAIISLVCAVIQIYSFLKPSNIAPTTVKERRMTLTIIMLTVVCLVCNIPYTVVVTYIFLSEVEESPFGLTWSQAICFIYTLNTVLPFIQAILNPAILLFRGSALREFVMITVRRPFNRRSTVAVDETEMEVISNHVNISTIRDL